MAISAVSNANARLSEQLSSGKRINSAADDAAGLAIAKKMEAQTRGYDVGTDNAQAGKDMLDTAEGAIGSITDSLQRIREISLQASNSAVYSADDMQKMQDEVDQLKQGIQTVARDTEFNTMKLLDGSKADLHLATHPSGNGMTIQTENTTLESLGIADYDVTGNFDITKIDEAIAKLNESRSSIGATTNVLESTIDFNNYTSENLTSSRSRIEDLDMAKAISEREKNRVMQEYEMYFAKKKVEDEQNVNRLLQF